MSPTSSPLSSSSPRKLLRTDTKPKAVANPPAAPLNSASSSSTTTIPTPEKRTRDQPNLSDCHCCGRHINHTNPKDRLQPLDSIWRVVLLCRKCRKKFHSGQTCPYCFKETENSGNLFRCSVCQRKIHKDCVRDYKNCAPWCYLGLDLGFTVCVDCWVPDSLKSSIRTCGRIEDKDASKCKFEAKDSLDKTVKDGNGVEKVKVAVNAKDQALKKVTVTKNAKQILELVGKKDRNEQSSASSDCSGKIKVVNDAEVAFRLHRAMNSSPRILRDKCPVNSFSDNLKSGNPNGLSCKRFVLGGDQSEDQSANGSEIERNDGTDENCLYSDANELSLRRFMYKREKKRKTWQEIRSTLPEQMKFRLQLKDSGSGRHIKWDGDIWEILVCVGSDNIGSCVKINRFGQDPVVYKRTRFRQKACEGNGIEECSFFDNWRATFESQNHQSDDTTHELPLVESGTFCTAKCYAEEGSPNRNCNPEDDRYFLKYTRTDRSNKCNDKLLVPERSCNAESDRYVIKYSKRIKRTKLGPTELSSDTILSAKQACAPCSSDTLSAYSEKCDGELNLPHGGNDEEPGRYFYKYVKRLKGSHSGPVVEDYLHSDR